MILQKRYNYRGGNQFFPRINKDRTVYFFEEVTSQSANLLIESLLELDRDKKKRPITMYICSPGGDCGSGFAIIDIIHTLRCPVRAVAVGEICSMAPAIFVACKERLITPHTYVMLHPVSTYSSDYVQFAKSRLKQAEDLEEIYDSYFFKRTSIPKDVYNKCKNSELWLTAAEAIKYGIATKLTKQT